MSLLQSLQSITQTSKKRVGRGFGSGRGGHTAGRGNKGQLSRTGAKIPLWFEGGQLPLIKRVPMMRGKGRFKSHSRTAPVSLTDIQKMSADVITLESLKLEKVIPARSREAKIIATGFLGRKVTLKGVKVTKAAVELVKKAGGTVEAGTKESA